MIAGLEVYVFSAFFSTFLALVSLELTLLPGSEKLHVVGSARPLTTVHLRLSAHVSPELPDVDLNRFDVACDASGRYDAVVPVAPAPAGALVTVRAWQDGETAAVAAYALPGTPL